MRDKAEGRCFSFSHSSHSLFLSGGIRVAGKNGAYTLSVGTLGCWMRSVHTSARRFHTKSMLRLQVCPRTCHSTFPSHLDSVMWFFSEHEREGILSVGHSNTTREGLRLTHTAEHSSLVAPASYKPLCCSEASGHVEWWCFAMKERTFYMMVMLEESSLGIEHMNIK